MIVFNKITRTRLFIIAAVSLTIYSGIGALSDTPRDELQQRFELPVFLVSQIDAIQNPGTQSGGVSPEAMEVAGMAIKVASERVELVFSLDRLLVPVAGVQPEELDDSFYAARSGGRTHEAIDIAASRGTPLVAVCDGTIIRKHTNRLGGKVLYLLSPDGQYAFYYAHLDGYAPGIQVGRTVLQGDTLGYVGNSGNARYTVAHLHFQVIQADGRRPGQLYRGRKLNPYRLFQNSEVYDAQMGRALS